MILVGIETFYIIRAKFKTLSLISLPYFGSIWCTPLFLSIFPFRTFDFLIWKPIRRSKSYDKHDHLKMEDWLRDGPIWGYSMILLGSIVPPASVSPKTGFHARAPQQTPMHARHWSTCRKDYFSLSLCPTRQSRSMDFSWLHGLTAIVQSFEVMRIRTLAPS